MKQLGLTKLMVSRIGLGLAALGRPGYINLGHADDLGFEYEVDKMEAHAHSMLDAAYQAGVYYFDAARSYGQAEAFLGSWLRSRAMAPGQLTVGSKWGYTYTAGWQAAADVHEAKEHSISVLRKQWQESTDYLAPYLKLYQIHSATLESGVLENAPVLAELARLKSEEGIAIGLTVSGAKQAEVIRKALEVQIGRQRLFDTVQVTWNLLERSTSTVLTEAKQTGMGIIVKEALANGRLTARNQMPAFSENMAMLKREAQRLKTTIDALSIAAVLEQPWVDVVLSGAAKLDHLRSNLQALDVYWDDEASAHLSSLEEIPERYWKIRSELEWN
jgi:aryl-alcohol dehydrogenase-like predicted oxidoreductase